MAAYEALCIGPRAKRPIEVKHALVRCSPSATLTHEGAHRQRALLVRMSLLLFVTNPEYNGFMREGLSSVLYDMGPVQLALLFLVAGAYLIAINASIPGGARSGAASTAFVSSIGFAALSPSLMTGVAFLALAVLSVAAFVGATWLLSELLDLEEERGTVVMEEVQATERRTNERRWGDLLGNRFPALLRTIKGKPL